MNLETAKRIFTEGFQNGWNKDCPYKGKEADAYFGGQCASSSFKSFEDCFLNWRNDGGDFPLSYRERAELNKRLIPKEFWDMMESQAYDRGHSAGQEETDMILMEIVNDFVGALTKYAARTGKTLV